MTAPPNKPLSEWSDVELETERKRRRRLRGPKRGSSDAESGINTRIRQSFANLELPISASLRDVRERYEVLRQRYRPERFESDREKRKAAEELSQELRKAYETVMSYLKGNQ